MSELDCQSCGACCISNWDTETYVGIDEKDLGQLLPVLGDRADEVIGARGDVWNMGLLTKENVQGHITCIALEGRVGDCVSCSLYEVRPTACRAFKPGGESCKLAREEAGISN